jgi:hypothetical protein
VSAPSFGEIERFCKIDGWRQDMSVGGSRQPHIRYEKQLPDHRALRTQISHDRSSTPSPGRWKAILRNQLKITEAQFWEALSSRDPVDRTPPPPPPAPIPVADWVREGLRRNGLRDEQIDALGPVEAEQELHRRWSGGGAP